MREDVRVFLESGGKRAKRKAGERVIKQRRQSKPASNNSVLEIICKPNMENTPKNTDMSKYKYYEENARLKKENQQLKLLLNKYKQRYYRLLKKMEELQTERELLQPQSPSVRVKKLLKDREVPKDIENQLVEKVVLETQLKHNYKSLTRYRDKEICGRVVSGKIIRKYQKLSYVKNLGPKRLQEKRAASNLEYRKCSYSSKTPTMRQDVQNFL